VRVAQPSKARAARTARFDTAAPVLTRAVAAALLPMISRSSDLPAYSLVPDDRPRAVRRAAAPRRVRQPDNLIRQLARAGQQAVRQVTRSDPGETLARTIRRASAALEVKGRAGGWANRDASGKSERHARGKSGKEAKAAQGRGGSKGKGGGRGGSKGKGGKGGKGGRR
jgi:hypothetical protein